MPLALKTKNELICEKKPVTFCSAGCPKTMEVGVSTELGGAAMQCSGISDLLSSYIDGALGERERVFVEQHLAHCADCRSELASLRKLVAAAQHVTPVDPPSALRSRIAAATTVRREVATSQPGFAAHIRTVLSPRSLAWAGGFASLLAVAGIFVHFQQSNMPAGKAALKPLSTIPSPARVQEPDLASVRVASAKVADPEPRVQPAVHITRPHHHYRSQVQVAVVPKMKPVQKARQLSIPSAPQVADPAAEAAAMEDTTAAATVAYTPEESAAQRPSDIPAKQKILVKVAATPEPKQQEDTKEWFKQMKSQAAMKGRDTSCNVVNVFNARF